MSRLRGRSQNRESQETCPAGAGAAFQRKHFGAATARPRFMGLLLALATLLLYLPVCRSNFLVYDDDDYVTNNAVVQNGLTWAGVKWAFTTGHASNWHPLTWLSHMLDCELFGLNAGAQHYVNVLFHTANVVLLFALILRLTNAPWPGAFIAALFAWHPLHVESVAWISERKDVLSTFFGLLTLLSYARFAQSGAKNIAPVLGSRSPTPDYFFALVFFALGLMSKPMLVTLPFVMLLLDVWPLRRMTWDKWRGAGVLRLAFEKLPFFLLSAASCVITFLAQSQHAGGAVVSLDKVSLSYRLCNVLVSYGRYLLKFIWPVDLAVFYPLSDQIARVRILAIVAAMALVVISWVVWRMRRSCPYLLVGWLWYLGMLVPVIGLVQVGGAALADRYTYVPSIGLFIAAAFGLRDLAGRFQFLKIPIAIAAGLILAGCLMLTENQLRYWRDSQTLFSHAVAVTENNDVAHTNLGVALEQQGKLEDALAEYRTALKLAPDSAEAHNNLANLLAAAGHMDEALAEYHEALRTNPRNPAAHVNLGTLLVELGRFDEAMKHYAEAAQLDPADWHPPYLTGKALLKQGRDLEAIPYFRKAVQNDPNNLHVLTYLAQVLASDEDPKVRDGRAAFIMASKANALSSGIQPAMLDTLAMAYAELGSFDAAQNAARDALKLAKAYALTNDVLVIQQRLRLYQNHQPFRQSFTNAPPKELRKN
ncbi:MAG: tetratricopeptide repeat protein [Verrucomicrobiia bacterium]|jgi:tetratricopeptide (TPR) repeat protein